MARCGCSSSGASGAAIARTNCVSPAGAGTPASPFRLTPNIDPDARNLLSCGAAGLLAPNPDNPGAWSVFTPTWRASTGFNPSIGDGILVGIYRKRGHSLQVMIELVFGTSTNSGAGLWSWDLPPGLVCGFSSPMPFLAFDSTPGTYKPGTALAPAQGPLIGSAVQSDGTVLGSALAFGFGSAVYLGGTVYVTT